MPVRADRKRASVGSELGADSSPVFGAFVDLEREYGGSGVRGDDGDAVGSNESAEDVRCHRVSQPELYRRVFAVGTSVERTDGVYGIEGVAYVCGRCWTSSGPETLVPDLTDSVGELGSTGRRVCDCRALEEARLVEMEQAFLAVADLVVDELGYLP
jgi:hypothetical protein